MPVSSSNAGAAAREALRALQENHIAYRKPLGFNRSVVVERLLLEQARICIGADRNAEYDDTWDYASVNEAIAEAILWDPKRNPEPACWVRHPRTGRRRPGGCEALEYVRP